MKWYKYSFMAMGVLAFGFAGLMLPKGLSAQTVGIAYGQKATGEISGGDLRLSAGQLYDEFSFTGQQGNKVLINLSSLDVDTVLWLLDTDRKILMVDDDSGQGTNSVISNYALPKTGKYYIWATSHTKGEMGAYELTLNQQPVLGTATALVSKQTVNGTLGAGDVQLNNGQYLDVYRFTADPTASINITMQSNNFNSYLWLTDESGKVLTVGNDGKNTTNSQITFVPTLKGTYKVWASSYNPQATGNYSLTMEVTNSLDPLALAPILETVSPISNGQVVNNELSAGFSQLNTGQLVNVYSFNGITGQVVTIDLKATVFDSYLRLFDADGKLVKMTDDEKITNLKLSKSGTYLIWASSVFPGNEGPYSLSLTQTSVNSGDIVGKITNTCGATISGAKVKTATNLYFTKTGVDGKYSLTAIAPATYSIIVSADGYETATIPNSVLSANQLLNVNIKLKPIGKLDSDGDGIPDECDNCILVANSNQMDSDGDGYGNACDGDLNNDKLVNTLDLGLFKKDVFSQNPRSDLNGDGRVNTLDLGLFKKLVAKKPGPSAFVK